MEGRFDYNYNKENTSPSPIGNIKFHNFFIKNNQNIKTSLSKITKENNVSYYIITREQMINLIKQSDDAWRTKSGKTLESPDYSIKIYIKRDDLDKFKDKWDNLFV